MGQGGTLRIINASNYVLKLSYCHSYQMNSWDGKFPSVINQGEIKDVYIEWDEYIFNTSTDDSGNVGYSIVGTDRHFEIQARWRYLQVDWQNTIQDPKFCVQPNTQIANLGWVHDGIMALTFCAVNDNNLVNISHLPIIEYSVKKDFKNVDNTKIEKELVKYVSIQDKGQPFSNLLAMAEEKGGTKLESNLVGLLKQTIENPEQILEESYSNGDSAYLKNWMETYGPAIGNTTLDDLTLVCTHNSGTYKMVSPFGSLWTKCQNLSISDQLNKGVRVLDLRVGEDNGNFILVHDKWRSEISLEDALKQVQGFIAGNPKEVIILDFHSFTALNGQFDENKLYNLVTTSLGNLIYHYNGHVPTLSEIWSTQSRVIVSWSSNNKPTEFFPVIDQKWFDKDNLGDLYSAIQDEMKNSHDNKGLWSICAIITPSISNITPIQSIPELSNWFQAGGEWAKNANIIAVDFVEKTNIVQQAISECLIKSVSKKYHNDVCFALMK